MQGTEVLRGSPLGNSWKPAWHKHPKSFLLESYAKNMLPNKLLNLHCSLYLSILRLLAFYFAKQCNDIQHPFAIVIIWCSNDVHIYSYLTTAFQCFLSRFHIVLAKENCVPAFKSNNSPFISVFSWCYFLFIELCYRECPSLLTCFYFLCCICSDVRPSIILHNNMIIILAYFFKKKD